MAIVGDYMVNGNCTICGKYLPKGTLCCDKMVQSNYNKWWDEMQKKKEKETSTLTINVKKRSIGIGIRGIKDIMKESGPKFFAEIVEKNNRLREEEKLMNKEKYILRVYNEKGAMVQEHEEAEKYNIMNRIYVAISVPNFVLQDMDIVKLGNVSENDSLIMYKIKGRFVR
ncbi:hypothetical protein HOBO_252 [Bacillus phage Hobo]|uniref:Uncharacterized protein n=2 Tax=Caeruleovirus BM15 TaxID=1985178 RepID=A0A0S2MUV4_9CAUD|nr:hypothetical protein FD732_gp089 [Bacillus phage BM15]ALO79660.1 hypothetical protein BM10_256 [Bacillus phage BM15]AXQ67007.1 hypothetical protein HOBO_252 [Bacillus phage Hobo]